MTTVRRLSSNIRVETRINSKIRINSLTDFDNIPGKSHLMRVGFAILKLTHLFINRRRTILQIKISKYKFFPRSVRYPLSMANHFGNFDTLSPKEREE